MYTYIYINAFVCGSPPRIFIRMHTCIHTRIHTYMYVYIRKYIYVRPGERLVTTSGGASSTSRPGGNPGANAWFL